MKKNIFCLFLLLILFYTGCGGRAPNPVAYYYPGDEDRTCESLAAETTLMQDEIAKLQPKANKFLSNAFWLIIWPPAMDLREREKIEIDAFRRRCNRLTILAADKGCQFVTQETKQQMAKAEKETP